MHIHENVDRYFRLVDEPGQQRDFTLHIDFEAADEEHARLLTELYARGLASLRLEVDAYSARLSPGDDWSAAEPVFCLAPGPDPADICTELAHHPGEHSGPGVTRSWRSGQAPASPGLS